MKNFILHPITIFIFFIASFVFSFSLLFSAFKNYKNTDVIEKKMNQVSILQQEVGELKGKNEYTQSDMYKEHVSRVELHMQKPGETIVLMPDNIDFSLPEKSVEEDNFVVYKRWLKLIF